MNNINEADIRKQYEWLNHKAETEIRLINNQKQVFSKFIHNVEELIETCKKHSGQSHIYIGVNERKNKGTKIEDIETINNFVVDIDNKGNFINTQEVALKIKEEAVAKGFKEPLFICSGNGFHLYFALEPIENNEENRGKIKAFGKKLKAKYETAESLIDEAVFEPARVMRLAGTMNIKPEVNLLAFVINKEVTRNNDNALTQEILATKPENSILKVGELETSLSEVISKEEVINKLFNGDISGFQSRSEAELSLVCRLVRIGLDKEQMFKVMTSCKIGKWLEAPVQYRELTYKKAVELIKEEKSDKSNPFKKLHYATEHLPFYHEFSSLVGLYGRHYIPIIKARWYQLHGGILQQKISVGKLITDTRVHIAYPIVTEGGKNEIIYSIKSLIKAGIRKDNKRLFVMSEPISYSPESLVGKYIEREIPNPAYLSGEVKTPKRIKTRIENKGHFNNDFLEFDECNKLITSSAPEEQQAREYLSKSENPIGKNMVEKRLVDDLPSESVAYCPEDTNSYYFQPYGKIPESAMLQGFMRRKLIPVGNVNLFLVSADETNMSNKLEDNDFSEEDYKHIIIKHLEAMRGRMNNSNFIFSEEAKKLLSDYSVYLSEQGKLHSEKIENYCKLTKYSYLSNLVKMACIISASYYTNIVDENCVALAYMDLVELSQNTFDFVYERVEGEFDYGVTWKGAGYKEKECLKFLFNAKALSVESSKVSIEEFLQNVVMPIFKVKETQARQRYLEMKRKKLLDSKQVGEHDTRVWLNFNPTLHKTYLEGDRGYKGYDTYNTIFLAKNDIVRALKPSQPQQPQNTIGELR